MMNHHKNLISAMSGFCLVVCWQIHMGSCDNRVSHMSTWHLVRESTLDVTMSTLFFSIFHLTFAVSDGIDDRNPAPIIIHIVNIIENPAIYINLPGHSVSYIMNWWMVQNINRVVSTPPEIVQPYFPNMNRFISLRRSWLKLEPNTWDAQQTGQQWDQRFEGILVEKCISSGPAPSQ